MCQLRLMGKCKTASLGGTMHFSSVHYFLHKIRITGLGLEEPAVQLQSRPANVDSKCHAQPDMSQQLLSDARFSIMCQSLIHG